jgi:subtilisin family serine protease
MPGIADNVGMDIEINYDLMKLFHKYKPVNPVTGRKNPTIVNGSWGYQAAFLSSSNVGYSFRGSTGTFVGNDAVTNQITAMKEGLSNQVSGAYRSWSSSSRSSSTDTAAAEMIAEGVIYVAAAGNNNQRLGIGATDIDRNNYMEDEYFAAGDSRFGGLNCPCNHRDWMNPQGIGFDSGNDFHPVICVGAMDEFINTNSSERKASYSNNGPGIDVWAPADETLSAGTNSVTGYTDYQRYDDSRFYDCYFNGTSAAAPVVTGVIALYLQSNPAATAIDVKNWLKTQGSKVVPTSQYQDETTNDSTTAYWTGLYNMRGAEKRILFNPFTNNTIPKIEGVSMSGITFSQF